jgi:hypothetical protein
VKLITQALEANAVVKKKACVEPGVCLTTILLDPETRPKEPNIYALERFGFQGIVAHTIVMKLVILQFRKCLTEAIGYVHLRSIVDNDWTVGSIIN